MLPSWLKIKSVGNNTPLKHFVLGTELKKPLDSDQDEIIFGCGCFWGAEKGFWKLPGVSSTAVGYAGGEDKNPTYQKVCSGRSGHTEVVKVVWEKSKIDLSDLLKLFWECHDPTQVNRQGNDHGSQYRSAIYLGNESQLNKVNASCKFYQEKLSLKGLGEITTEVRSNQIFYFAEDYHQQYLAKPGSRPYCSAMPTKIELGNFTGANYKLPQKVWENYNWEETHCILRSNNEPINI